MTTVFIIEIAVIVVAAAAVPRIRRAGDESWRRQRIRQAVGPMAAALTRVQLTIAAALTPALVKAAAASSLLGQRLGELTGTDAVTRELVRLTLGGRPARPELEHAINDHPRGDL